MDDKTQTNEEIKRESNEKKLIIIIALLIFIITVIGISVATVTYTKQNNNINTISTGNIYLNYTEDTNGISITDAYPLTDEVGKNLTNENQYFDFTVSATLSGDVVAKYEIAAIKESSSTLSNDEVKLYLEKKVNDKYEEVMAPQNYTPLTESTSLGTEVGSMLLDSASVSKSEVIQYRLRMWVADDVVLDSLQRSFSVRVAIKAKVDLND